MRVTTKTKQRTRDRIVDVARNLFHNKGFKQTTTRDIAKAARIAAGTLFNYFPTKEDLALTLLADALDQSDGDFARRRRGDESLDEDLFLFVVSGIRRLEPYRHYAAPVIETGLSPFTPGASCAVGERLRVRHLESVVDILAAHDASIEPSFVAMHLFWTLYLGVLAFWSKDASPKQEDTLIVLDQSIRLFVGSLTNSTGGRTFCLPGELAGVENGHES